MVAMVLTCFVVNKGETGFQDGNDLFSHCEERASDDPGGHSQWGVCIGYILGAYDARESAVCIPSEVKVTQVRE